MVPQQEEMEDIMSSIRTTMNEEKTKVGSGSADLIDAAAAQDGAEDDVVELQAEDMVEAPAEDVNGAEKEELIDIAAFASSGESKPAEGAAVDLGESEESAATPEDAAKVEEEAKDAADEFDRLLAEISEEKQQKASEAEDKKRAFMAEEEALGGEPAEEKPVKEDVAGAEENAAAEAGADVAGSEEQAEDSVSDDEVADELVEAVAEEAAAGYTLQAVETAQGTQVALPAEVLAMALRPMVKDWLAKNLPEVVERLVKEEITKLG